MVVVVVGGGGGTKLGPPRHFSPKEGHMSDPRSLSLGRRLKTWHPR